MAFITGISLVRNRGVNVFQFTSRGISPMQVKSKPYSCHSIAPLCSSKPSVHCLYGRSSLNIASCTQHKLTVSYKHTSSHFLCLPEHGFHTSTERSGGKLLERTSSFLSKASMADSATASAVQNDLSLLIGKRAARRPKVKEAVERDQVVITLKHGCYLNLLQ